MTPFLKCKKAAISPKEATRRRCVRLTWACRWTPPWTSRRNLRTSSFWKRFDGAGERRHRGAENLRQHGQVHQDDRELKLRQYALRACGLGVPALPVDAGHSHSGAEPHLRHFLHRHPVGQR